jgi:hypothetical protein
MSDYLEKADSSDEEEAAPVCTLSETEIAEVRENCAALKAEGNACFSAKDYDGALAKYTVGLGQRDRAVLVNCLLTYVALLLQL